MVRASGERVGEIASDVDLLSRIELAAVEPQWQTVDVARWRAAAGAVVERGSTARVVADPDLLGTALGRLVEDGRRPASPVRAAIEDLEEAVALELSGTGASPAGESVAPTIGARLAARIVERHAGTFRAGGAAGAWWIRLTLPSDPRRIQRGLRVLLVGAEGGDDVGRSLARARVRGRDGQQRLGLRLALAASAVDVVLVPIALAVWTGVERLPANLRRRGGLRRARRGRPGGGRPLGREGREPAARRASCGPRFSPRPRGPGCGARTTVTARRHIEPSGATARRSGKSWEEVERDGSTSKGLLHWPR